MVRLPVFTCANALPHPRAGGPGTCTFPASSKAPVELTIEPPSCTKRRPMVMFTRGKLKSFTLSLADPDGFIAALQSSSQR